MNTCMGTIKYLRYGEGRMKWKKLSEELPPEDDYVLFFTGTGDVPIIGFRTTDYALPNEEPYYPPITEYIDSYGREIPLPEYWMPLPNGPVDVPRYRCPHCGKFTALANMHPITPTSSTDATALEPMEPVIWCQNCVRTTLIRGGEPHA